MKNSFLSGFLPSVIILLSIGISGCSKKDDELKLPMIHPAPLKASPEPEVKPEPPKYVYPYSSERDPFVSLAGDGVRQAESSSGESGSGFLNKKGEFLSLELRGIMHDRGGKVAMIVTSDGESYFLKAGKVYTRKNQVVSGVTGIIRDESIVLISENRVRKELSLSKKESGRIETGTASGQSQTSAAQSAPAGMAGGGGFGGR